MAKFSGVVAYAKVIETSPGVWSKTFVTRKCYGDVIRNARKTENSGKVNDDFYVNAQISIVADPYIRNNFMDIAYVEWLGYKWRVTSVDPTQFPRIVLELGGLYNGDEN